MDKSGRMSFLHRLAGLTLRDGVRSSEIWSELGVKPLLLHVERRLGHLIRMHPGPLFLEVFFHTLEVLDILSGLRTSLLQEEQENVAWERDIRITLLSLQPPG